MEHPSSHQQPNSPTDNLNTTTTTTPNQQQPHPQTLSTRRAASNPAFHAKLSQMTLQLAPLVQLTTGAIHPYFPKNLLAFWLLTDAQLDALAHFYHQRTPGPWTRQYPCPVHWPAGLGIEEKRRKLGRFIGLRGCESPQTQTQTQTQTEGVVVVGLENGVGEVLGRTEEEIIEGARRERVRRGQGEGSEGAGRGTGG